MGWKGPVASGYLQVTLSASMPIAGGDDVSLMDDKLMFKTVDVSFLNRIAKGVFMMNIEIMLGRV